jgi:aspartyl aminopeptidase
MENNALALLQNNPTKTNIAQIVDHFVDAINDGNMSAIDVAINIAALESLAKELRSRITENVITDLFHHPKQKAEIRGATVTMVDSNRFDYSHIEKWSDLETVIVTARDQQKEIEEEEKKWRRAELPIKSSSSSFKIQLSK